MNGEWNGHAQTPNIQLSTYNRISPIFAGLNGRVAEWLGSALQKLLLRFESARDLKQSADRDPIGALFFPQYLAHIPIGTPVRWCIAAYRSCSMISIRHVLLLHSLPLLALSTAAQELGAIGKWRDHFSYVNAVAVTEAGSAIYCASSTGAFKFDRNTEEIERLTKVNALSDVGINGLAWNDDLQMLLVHYTNGNLDLISSSSSHNMSDIKRSSLLGDKSINAIHCEGSLAYLSCGFGIVVVDLAGREVRETWFIGPGGSQVQVNQLTMTADSIYAATNSGLFVASRFAPNLASFSSWRPRTDMGGGVIAGPFNAVVYFNDRIMANYASAGDAPDTVLVLGQDDLWVRHEGLFGRKNRELRPSHNGQYLTVTHGADIQLLDASLNEVNFLYGYVPTQISTEQSLFGSDGRFWVADGQNGLVSSSGGTTGRIIVPNGPRSPEAYRMAIEEGALYVATGAVAGNWTNTYSKNGVHHYIDGLWETDHPYNNSLMQGLNSYGGAVNDIMAVAVDPNNGSRAFAGSWEEGLIEYSGRAPAMIHNVDNSGMSPVVGGSPDQINVAGVDVDDDGNVWVTNSGATNSIAVFTKNGQWYSFNPGSLLNGNYLVADILAASNGYKWVIRPRGNALMVFNDNGTIDNTSDDQFMLVKNVEGAGGLPTPDVYSIAEDLDGEIWIGTNEGVAVIYDPTSVFSGGPFDAQQILIEQDGNVQILFETEAISAIEVDGADRKWVGTQSSGVFLVSPDGRTQIHHFTAENSPIPSNVITSLAIDDRTGEVFIGTDRGIISYRSDATDGEAEVSCASVFPNPVRSTHTGPIAVTGLMRDSEVKITDVSGNLVFRTTSLGGQAIWDGNNMGGERVATGVYLVFATDRTGAYKCNTKLLVVR